MPYSKKHSSATKIISIRNSVFYLNISKSTKRTLIHHHPTTGKKTPVCFSSFLPRPFISCRPSQLFKKPWPHELF
jgi:hypothetical protein